MTQLLASTSDLHTILPSPTDALVDKTWPPATTGVHEEGVSAVTMGLHEKGVLASATIEGTLPLISAQPTAMSLIKNPLQLGNGPASKKRKVIAHAIVSDSISNK